MGDLNVVGIFFFFHRILTSYVATVDHLNLSLGVAYFLLLSVMAAAFWLIGLCTVLKTFPFDFAVIPHSQITTTDSHLHPLHPTCNCFLIAFVHC